MSAVAVLEERSDPPAFSRSKKQVWVAWLLLPCVFLALHNAFVRAGGPHYLASKVDPDYAYLCNSLNLAVGRSPDHVDHPGTSLQLFGAVVITVAHPFSGKAQKIDAVLKNPEQHLRLINLALAFISASALAVVGIITWRRTGDWQMALLLQATPLLLGARFRFISRVSPEAVLLIIGLLIALFLFLEVQTDCHRRRTVPLIALLAATGIITKINFFPLAFTPLAALRTGRQRISFLLWTGALTLLWLIPLGERNRYLFTWVKGLVFQQGKYGAGKAGILSPAYFSFLERLLADNLWLASAVVLSFATALYGCIRWKHQTPQQGRWIILLGGLAFAQTLQIAMTAKYGVPRYLLPAVVFCGLNLVLLVQYWSSRLPPTRPFLVLAGFIAVLLSGVNLRKHHERVSETSKAEMQIARALESDPQFKDEPKVFCYGASSLYHALWFGNRWAGNHYTNELAAIYGSHPPRYVVHITPENSGELSLMSEPKSFGDLQALPSFLLCGRLAPARLVLGFLPPNAKPVKVLGQTNDVVYRVSF